MTVNLLHISCRHLFCLYSSCLTEMKHIFGFLRINKQNPYRRVSEITVSVVKFLLPFGNK